jgi:hypothetical protein
MRREQQGYMIIEAAVYGFILLILLGVAYAAMYGCIDRSIALHRNADGFVSALRTGEHWRADVRGATNAIRVETEPPQFHIPSAHGEILYRFETNAILRRAGSNPWTVLLPSVKSSQMQPDARERVSAWRWELELLPVRKDNSNTNRIRPLFSFVAVPGGSTNK